MSAATSALPTIDGQESFCQMPLWSEAEVPAFQKALLRLQAGSRAKGVPVVPLFHGGQGAGIPPGVGLRQAAAVAYWRARSAV